MLDFQILKFGFVQLKWLREEGQKNLLTFIDKHFKGIDQLKQFFSFKNHDRKVDTKHTICTGNVNIICILFECVGFKNKEQNARSDRQTIKEPRRHLFSPRTFRLSWSDAQERQVLLNQLKKLHFLEFNDWDYRLELCSKVNKKSVEFSLIGIVCQRGDYG